MRTLLLCLFSLSAAAQSHRTTAIQQLLGDYKLPGIQLIYTHGRKTETYNLGTAGPGSGKPVTSNTVFEAASLSKSVFAYIVMRLYDRGLISLDSSLLGYLAAKRTEPNARLYSRFDPSDPRYARITARMVLHHTTGLPNWGDSAGARLLFPPDSCFSYSGEGYQFLQYVVEKRTGKKLNELAQQEVFGPLKMTNSSYCYLPRFDSTAAFGNGPDQVKRHSNQNAAFSLLTTAHDYTLFLQALIAGKGLKPATRHLMLETATAANWYHHKPTAATYHIAWGLGVGLQYDLMYPRSSGRQKALWHWGDNGAFKAFYMAYPRRRETLVYFVHDYRGLFITQQLTNLFFNTGACWGILWSGEGYESPWPMETFMNALKEKGFDSIPAVHRQLIMSMGLRPDDDGEPDISRLSEHDLNEYGFLLMDESRHKDAAAIFRYNLSLHPKSANAFDSLAEAYEALGEKALALENFKRSLELNPGNDYAAEHIKKLQNSLQSK